MKTLNLSPITTGKAMPLKKGSLIFVQLAYKEMLEQICLSKIGSLYDNSKYYIVWGCETIVSGGTTTILKGCIYYSGEMYISNVVAFANPAGGNVIVGSISVSQYSNVSADPVTYSDLSTANVHTIREFAFSTGASGSGDVDYSDLVSVDEWTTPSSITLTPDVGIVASYGIVCNRFRLHDRTLHWNFAIAGINLSSVPIKIELELPPELLALGYLIKSDGRGISLYMDNTGVVHTIYLLWFAGNNYIQFMRDTSFTTAFATGTNQSLDFNTTIELGF